MNATTSGHYSCPVQYFHQVDFPAMPPYCDLTNLMDAAPVPQTGYHFSSPFDSSSHQNTGRDVSAEITSGRSRTSFYMSSMSTVADSPGCQGLPGNFFHFQHLPNQFFSESSYHIASNKIPHSTKPSWNSSSLPHLVNEPPAVENVDATKKSLKEQISSKERKEKTKRLHYIKTGCADSCRRCCKQKISQSMREALFNKYWNMEDDIKRKEFIAQNAIKMPMMKCKEGSRRSFSVDWAFSINGESFSVCKLFFLHTLDISENTAYAAIKESKFFNSDAPVIKKKAEYETKAKPTWVETDLDDHSFMEKYSCKARYESFTKKEKFTELRPGCTNLCRRNCQSKFTQVERLAIFREYHSLSNIRRQREYISRYITRVERKRIRAGEGTRRGCSIQWSLPLKGKEIPVCKTFFLHTVGVGERAAYNIGLQNEIKPIRAASERSARNKLMALVSCKRKSCGSVIAKERLKSAIKISRKHNKPKICVNDMEEITETCSGSKKESRRKKTGEREKGGKCGGKRKIKKTRDKTVRFKKTKKEKIYENIAISDKKKPFENITSSDKEHATKSQTSVTQMYPQIPPVLPVKTRERKNRLPVLRIKKGKVFHTFRKRRNPYKRKEMPAKNAYSLCPENCRKKCRQNLPEEARREIFMEFWSLKNMEEQRKYIAKYVKKLAKTVCTCLVASHLRGKRRGYKLSWNLNFRGLEVSVCKTFFMHVLRVSDSVVYKAVRENASFTPNVAIQPCKHFTGCNHESKASSSGADLKKTESVTSKKGCQEMGVKSGLENSCEKYVNKQDTETVRTSDVSTTDNVCYSELTQAPETNVTVCGSADSSNGSVGGSMVCDYIPVSGGTYSAKALTSGCTDIANVPVSCTDIANVPVSCTDIASVPVSCTNIASVPVGCSTNSSNFSLDHSTDSANIPVNDDLNSTIDNSGSLTIHKSSHSFQISEKVSHMQLCMQNGLYHSEVNYEALTPHLTREYSQELGESLQVHYPSQQIASYGPCERLRSILNTSQESKANFGIYQDELLQKPVDTFHSVFCNGHPTFPALADPRIEPVHSIPPPRNLPPHFSVPQNNIHHSHFSAQASSSGHHSAPVSQLYPSLPAAHTNHTNHMGFTNEIMENLYYNHRYHSFSMPVLSRPCVQDSSEYTTNSSFTSHDSPLMQTLKNTSCDMYVPNLNETAQTRKKKKKHGPSPKPKQDKIKVPRARKTREKKPFKKSIKEGCANTCKRKCGQKIPQEAREQLFSEFWGLESDARRREYVLPIVRKVPKKTCSGVNSRRCCTIQWSIPYKEEIHIVCKRFFLHTFDIGEKFVKTVFEKVERKGGSMEDLRGRHCKRSNIFIKEQEEIENLVRSVSSLRTLQCIICKKDFMGWCFGSGVVISQLYKTYAEKRKQDGKKPACRTSFVDICSKKFHLRSGSTQENLCGVCIHNADVLHGTKSTSNAVISRLK